MRAKAFGIGVVSGVLFLSGCFGAGSWSCSSLQDTFRCSFGGAGSGERAETWKNSGSKALYSISLGGTGSVTVTVKDAAGETVLAKPISGTGGQDSSGETETGTPGNWEVRIKASGLAGGLEVTLTKG